MMSSISPFENTGVNPDAKTFIWIAPSVPDAAASNLNGIKALLANGVSKFFVNGKPAVINGLKQLRNSLSWLVIFVLVPFTCVRAISNLWDIF